MANAILGVLDLALKSFLLHPQVGKSYGGPREALLLSANFVLNQLPAMAGPNANAKSADYRATPFGTALAAEVGLRARCSALTHLHSVPD